MTLLGGERRGRSGSEQDPVDLDLSIPRRCIYRRFTGHPGPCPRCGGTLYQQTQPYLVATRRGTQMTDSFVMSNDMGWYCAGCPTVVIHQEDLDTAAANSLPGWDVGNEFAVLGIIDLDAIPRAQRHLPLDAIDPLPLVRFSVGPDRRRVSGSGRRGKSQPKRRKRTRPRKKKRRS